MGDPHPIGELRPLFVLVLDDAWDLIDSMQFLASVTEGIVIKTVPKEMIQPGRVNTISSLAEECLRTWEDEGTLPDLVVCDWDMGMWDPRSGDAIVEGLRASWPTERFGVGYAIWSGLHRAVPEGVGFILKDQNAFDGIVAAAEAARSGRQVER